jgi:hypothetical protein
METACEARLDGRMNIVGEIDELRPIDGFAFPVRASPGTEE